ncbi:MAG: hypothetical protein ACYC5S_09590 [Thiobacillus sp.]
MIDLNSHERPRPFLARLLAQSIQRSFQRGDIAVARVHHIGGKPELQAVRHALQVPGFEIAPQDRVDGVRLAHGTIYSIYYASLRVFVSCPARRQIKALPPAGFGHTTLSAVALFGLSRRTEAVARPMAMRINHDRSGRRVHRAPAEQCNDCEESQKLFHTVYLE